jgi:hypothetical protein
LAAIVVLAVVRGVRRAAVFEVEAAAASEVDVMVDVSRAVEVVFVVAIVMTHRAMAVNIVVVVVKVVRVVARVVKAAIVNVAAALRIGMIVLAVVRLMSSCKSLNKSRLFFLLL